MTTLEQRTARDTPAPGYRVLRRLAPGERCELLVGHAPEPGAVVLKLVAGPGAIARATRELEALERARGEHVVRVVDFAAVPAAGERDGACLVLERLTGGELPALLARRASWAAGEVVTLVAPLAAALARMHARGVAHGAIRPAHVLLTERGAPTLVGFGGAELFDPGAPEVVLERVAAVAADREALRGLAVAMLGLVAGERRPAALGLARELSALPGEQVLDGCRRGLFALAAALPIAEHDPPGPAAGAPLARTSRDAATGVPAAAGSPAGGRARDRGAETPGGDEAARRGGRAPGASGLLAGVLPDPWLLAAESALDGLAPRLRALLARRVGEALARLRAAWSARSPRARRVLVGGAALATALAAGWALVPPGGPDDPGDPAVAEDPVVAGDPLAAEAPAGDPSLATRGPEDDARAGEDPLVAALALLELRERCVRELSLLCLDGVAQQGSPALEADRARIRALQAGDELDPPLGPEPGDRAALEPRLVERLGGSAIVGLGAREGAGSLLLIREETGWRGREYLADPPSGVSGGEAPG